MAPPLYYGSDRLSLPGIDKVYYGDDLKYTAQTEEVDYLKFTANTAGSTVRLVNDYSNAPDIEISVNGGEWQTWDYSAITLPSVGSNVRMRGDNPNGFASGAYKLSYFTMTGSVAGSGNIMTLIDMVGEVTKIPNNYCFKYAFQNNTHLTSAPELPATVLKDSCYEGMFSGCTALVTGPSEIPAAELSKYACFLMFDRCTALTEPPEISATYARVNSCKCMFRGCTSLTYSPELHPTIDNDYCYDRMFEGCTSLTRVSPIGLTHLMGYRSCYSMFSGCSSLKVCDSSASGAVPFFDCPIYSSDDQSVLHMFNGTTGSYTRGTPWANGTYYWYT